MNFLPRLYVDSLALYPLSVSVTRRIFCLIFNRYMQVIAPPSSRTGGTIHIRHPTGYLHSHKACTLPGNRLGHWCPQLTLILTLISWTDTGTSQTSPTDIGLKQNTSNGRRYQVNGVFPLPQILIWHRSQSQPMQAPSKYLQQTLGLPRYLLGYKYLACQMPRFLQIFLNRRRGTTNFSQLLLRLPEIISTDSRAFEPGDMTPPQLSEIFSTSGPPTWS